MNTPMTEAQAAWVRATAWPAWMQAMDDDYKQGCFLFHTCACTLGVCVACSQHEHRHCLTRQHDGNPLGWDMEVYAFTRGRLPVNGLSVATVTVAGYGCRWVCPCRCWRPRRPGPTRARSTFQLDLMPAVA